MKLEEARQLLLSAACIILEHSDEDSISEAMDDIERARELLDARLGELIRKGEGA